MRVLPGVPEAVVGSDVCVISPPVFCNPKDIVPFLDSIPLVAGAIVGLGGALP